MYVFVNDAGASDLNAQKALRSKCAESFLLWMTIPIAYGIPEKEKTNICKLEWLRTEHPLKFRSIHIQMDFCQYPTF